MTNTVFKTASEPTQTPETAPERKETPGLIKGTPDVPQVKDLGQSDRLDVWETNNRREYAQDYFGIRETAHIFPMSMQWKYIDKYIKGEINNLGYENTKENYEKIISEIEEEIGSKNLISHKRLQRLSDYIKVIQKQKKLKEQQDKFKLYQENRIL